MPLLVVNELLDIADQRGNGAMHRRHKYRIVDAGPANPVLAVAELARLLVPAAHALHQRFVRLANQPRRKRQLAQLVHRLIHRRDVVLHLFPVIAPLQRDILFLQQRFLDIGLRAFDATRLRRLLEHMHADKEIDVRDVLGIHVQPAQFPVRLAEQLQQGHIVHYPCAMDGIGLKTLVMRLLHKAAGLEMFHLSALSLK